jgi:hypothetical protein
MSFAVLLGIPNCFEHENHSNVAADEILEISVDRAFHLIFTDSAVFTDFMSSRQAVGKLLSCKQVRKLA